MKEFNLQAALDGAKVVTRDGKEVKIAGYDPDAERGDKVIGWIKGHSNSWGESGSYLHNDVHYKDLFMAPTERKEWVVRLSLNCVVGPYFTKQDAELVSANYENSTIHEITILE